MRADHLVYHGDARLFTAQLPNREQRDTGWVHAHLPKPKIPPVPLHASLKTPRLHQALEGWWSDVPNRDRHWVVSWIPCTGPEDSRYGASARSSTALYHRRGKDSSTAGAGCHLHKPPLAHQYRALSPCRARRRTHTHDTSHRRARLARSRESP